MHRERAGQRPSQWHRLAPSTQQTQSARRSRTKWESLGAAERSGNRSAQQNEVGCSLAHVFGREEQQSLAVDSRVLEGLLQLCQANRAEPVPAATPQLSDPKQTNQRTNQRTSEPTNKQTPMARRARSQLPHRTSSVVHARTGLTRCEEGDSPASVRNLRRPRATEWRQHAAHTHCRRRHAHTHARTLVHLAYRTNECTAAS